MLSSPPGQSPSTHRRQERRPGRSAGATVLLVLATVLCVVATVFGAGAAFSSSTDEALSDAAAHRKAAPGRPSTLPVPGSRGASGTRAHAPAPTAPAPAPGPASDPSAADPSVSDPATDPATDTDAGASGAGDAPVAEEASRGDREDTAADTAGQAPTGSRPGGASSSSAAAPAPVAAAGAPTSARSAVVAAGTWLSGASGTGVASGEFEAWRGTSVTVAGTWADSNEGQVALWQLHPGGEFGSWNESLDIAIGAIDDGETWAEAAGGAYEGRWRQSLTNLRQLWGDRDGTLFIRFAHEMNGNWYPWSVDAGNHQDFIVAWQRFRALQQEIFPESQLVFCVNRESVGNGIDWRETFPGAENVDVIGVDYYNGWPYVADQAGWDSSVDDVDGYGAPKGLQAHLDFARSVGLPLSVPEWSGKASGGDSPAFIEAMHGFFSEHAGGGAGQLLYEVQFNVDMHGNDYRLFGGTRMPASAAAYQATF